MAFVAWDFDLRPPPGHEATKATKATQATLTKERFPKGSLTSCWELFVLYDYAVIKPESLFVGCNEKILLFVSVVRNVAWRWPSGGLRSKSVAPVALRFWNLWPPGPLPGHDSNVCIPYM